MIDYTLADCYGIIVDCDFKEKFEELLIEDGGYEWEWEDISNRYCPFLNTWTDTDCFFGIYIYIYTDDVYEINNSFPSEKEFKEFYELCERYGLLDMVKWEPKRYIITFVS